MEFLLFLFVIFYVIPRIMRALSRGRDGVIRMDSNPLSKLFDTFRNSFGKNTSMNMNNTHIPTTQIVGKLRSMGTWLVMGIIAVVILIKSITVVSTGETVVLSLFGKVYNDEISSGIHLINPLAKATSMSIRTEEYTMSVTRGEGQRQGADAISALTNEGLMVDLDITVIYHLLEDQASEVYRTLGLSYQEKIIRPEIRSTIREVIAQYDAKAIYSDKRAEVQDGIRNQLIETLKTRGIVVEKVLLRNVTLPQKLADSIQEKLRAEQESQRYDFVLEKEKKEAERKEIEAGGQREAQSIITESLTPRYLQYLYINELKEREGTIYVPVSSANGLPLFRGVQ